jgi:subtilisin family serine protease
LVLNLFLFFFSLALFLGCSHSSDKSTYNDSIDTTKSYAILGPLSGSTLQVVDLVTHQKLLKLQTMQYNGNNYYTTGSFTLDINSSFDDEMWVECSVEGGEDIDSDDNLIVETSRNLEGKLYAYMKVKDIRDAPIIINALTTFSVYMYKNETENLAFEEYLNMFAKRVFRKSINDDEVIDYRDLFAYIPYKDYGDIFVNPLLYKQLLSYGFMNALLENRDISSLLKSDEDGDGLSWADELLYGTDISQPDSNSDGIEDLEAYTRGLDPILRDSDKDGLEDYEEIYNYLTDPLLSDSDSDYLPDGVEVFEGGNPLDADVDGNGVVDGLDGDPFFSQQWYLKSEGTVVANTASVASVVGNDLDILELYHHYVGGQEHKVVVQVVDTGVEKEHEDLDVNENYSLNAVTHTQDPTPTTPVASDSLRAPIDVGHGTAVAGIIAAKTNNMLGVRGIIPRGEIAGSNWLEDQTLEEVKKVWVDMSEDVIVSNNSWGTYVFDDLAYETVLEEATHLRNEKGRIFVFASGNFREDFGNANLSYLANNPYVITVSALNHLDKYATYSNPGSNVLVSAYGGEHYYTAPTIMTTLLMGKSFYENEIPDGEKGSITLDEDTQRNYTFAMNGTSAAAPIVSGIIALTMQACPELSYRDMRWLIAHTAKRVDINNTTWVKNGAGLWHSIDYGYGKINPMSMVEMCQSRDFQPLPSQETLKASESFSPVLIPDTNTTITKTLEIDNNVKVEWVSLYVEIDHKYAGDIEIALISPSGTKTVMIQPNDLLYNAYENGFRFSSVAFIDEDAKGIWHIEITDRLPNDYGYLKKLQLEIKGY